MTRGGHQAAVKDLRLCDGSLRDADSRGKKLLSPRPFRPPVRRPIAHAHRMPVSAQENGGSRVTAMRNCDWLSDARR